jgi:hypothetical protein
MNSFPTQISNKFGIPLWNGRSYSGERKMKTEYKTKKTVFHRIGSLICLTDFNEGTLEFFPAHVEYFDDPAIKERGGDHSVAVFFPGVVHDGENCTLDFGESVTHVGDVGVSRLHGYCMYVKHLRSHKKFDKQKINGIGKTFSARHEFVVFQFAIVN